MITMEGDDDNWSTTDRFYSLSRDTFTKRELRAHERPLNLKGKPVAWPWSTDRIQNEAAALQFIAKHTTIPVPKVLSFEKVDGAYVLVTERVDGILLHDVPDDKMEEALKKVEGFMITTVLPQLQKLRSATIGSLNRILMAPVRITWIHEIYTWPAKTSPEKEYCFCHNDLSRKNIMVDPATLDVMAILDWEWSGFYPPGFEAPLWTMRSGSEEYMEIGASEARKVIDFLLDPRAVSFRECHARAPELGN